MDKKTLLFLVALEADYKDIASLCLSNKEISDKLCNNPIFWKTRIRQKRPGLLEVLEENTPLSLRDLRKISQYLDGKSNLIILKGPMYNLQDSKIIGITKGNKTKDEKLGNLWFIEASHHISTGYVWIFLQRYVDDADEDIAVEVYNSDTPIDKISNHLKIFYLGDYDGIRQTEILDELYDKGYIYVEDENVMTAEMILVKVPVFA